MIYEVNHDKKMENIANSAKANNKSNPKRTFLKVLFFLYLLILIRLIIFKYPISYFQDIAAGWSREVIFEGIFKANFTLFHTIDMYINNISCTNARLNIFGNLFAFIPFGFTLPIIHKLSNNLFIMLAHALTFIVGIEGFQLITGFGAFDVDDILLNTLGAIIGWVIYMVMKRITLNSTCF